MSRLAEVKAAGDELHAIVTEVQDTVVSFAKRGQISKRQAIEKIFKAFEGREHAAADWQAAAHPRKKKAD